MPLPLRHLLSAAACGAFLLALAQPAAAALPRAGDYSVHDHASNGTKFHVEFRVSKDRHHMRNVVLYSQHCDVTVLFKDEYVPNRGDVSIQRKVPAAQGGGTWKITGRFDTPEVLSGSFRVTKPDCDTGDRPFEAHLAGHDGHKGHSHGGGGHDHASAPKYPDLKAASSSTRAKVRRIWKNTRRAARELFPTYEATLKRGFVSYERDWERPVIFHVRSSRYTHDDRVLDPRRPESLVYWWPETGDPVLVGMMFRIWAKDPKPFDGQLFTWHRHFQNGHWGTTAMTHIWLTDTLRTALANCFPTNALEQSLPAFDYAKPKAWSGHETRPCSWGDETK